MKAAKPGAPKGNRNGQKGPEPRNVRFQVRLTETACRNLEKSRAPGQSRNDRLNELLEALRPLHQPKRKK